MKRRARLVILRAACVVAGIAVAALLGEVYLRVSNRWIGRHSDTMFQLMAHDAQLGWRMKPTIHETVDLVDVEKIPVSTNHAGFWDDEFVAAKPDGVCRIAFLGDSFTWGMGVTREQRFTDLIRASDRAWETLNFGVPGYGTDQSLLVWRHVARSYEPDLTVLTIYENDFVDNLYSVRFGRRKPYFVVDGTTLQLQGVPVDTKTFWSDGVYHKAAPPYSRLFPTPVIRRSRVAHWLVKNSDMVRLMYHVLQDFRRRGTVAAARRGYDVPSADDGTADDASLEPLSRAKTTLMHQIVAEMLRSVSDSGGKLMVVLAGHEGSFVRQRTMLDQAGVAYVDATTGVLAARIRGGTQGVYYRYSQHWTAEAHAVVAQMVAARIRAGTLCDEQTRFHPR